jgi:chemotaxis protein CheC
MDDTYFDILKELGNIGAGNATTALAAMTNSKIDMAVPKVALLDFGNITDMIGSEETILVGILFMLDGDIQGMMMFLMDRISSRRFINMLMGTDSDSLEFSEMELSALNEIGNIISGAYISSLAALTNMKIITSVPSLNIDMAEALLSVPAIEFGKIGDKVLMIETSIGNETYTDGYFLLIPDIDSYDKILAALGI